MPGRSTITFHGSFGDKFPVTALNELVHDRIRRVLSPDRDQIVRDLTVFVTIAPCMLIRHSIGILLSALVAATPIGPAGILPDNIFQDFAAEKDDICLDC